MLIVLPWAPPSSSSTRPASVGPWSGPAGRPVDQTVVLEIGDLVAVDAGEICSTPSRIVTERAIGIVSDEDQAPAMQVAPSSDDLASRLHGGLRVGLVVFVDDLTVWSTPASLIAALI